MAPRRSTWGPLLLEERPWLGIRNAETLPPQQNPVGADLPGAGAGHQPKLGTGADTRWGPGSVGPWLALSTPGEGLYPALMLQTPGALLP